MKRRAILLLCGAIVLGLVACSSLPSGVLGDAVSKTVESGTLDFQSGEVLCAVESGTQMETSYALAKILTPASDKTNNESEVVFVKDGSKGWSRWVVPSRRAEKADFKVGSVVLFIPGWSGFETMSLEEYRGVSWKLGRVTSTDQLFKNLVEVSGQEFGVKILRVPTVPVEE